ncbi:hypothetical protein Calkr_2154 [Caldicellulosiruptor acetigenus I77R1B]|uniref:Uncharacterized protein n=1 Tax=Caldicellulosiruptor acetigenus (strain ATCC 700853 / DSM 12137 / I77R1B) TaxID=632335 RepID=E4S5V9_CALA7|nr:hypothetical protein [Caldicellulosiruptor acetigenus]ADQ41619.1 hypothetical protein Calkr_2154 [Caldicellulosiruptor acetigenus I77R1B]
MNNLIYKTPVPEEKAREELKAFLEYFEREEGIDNLRFFKAEDIVYDIVYWAEPHEPWDHCQKTYLVHTDGTVEEVDGFEFFELQIWKVFEKYPQKLKTTKYIVIAENHGDVATICYTENTTAVQNKVLRIIREKQEIKQKIQKLLAGL